MQQLTARNRSSRLVFMAFKFAENVKRRRESQGLDGPTFADLAGVNKSTLLRIERGECDPKLSTVVAISKALKVSIDKLVK